jgi:hypothetical protein
VVFFLGFYYGGQDRVARKSAFCGKYPENAGHSKPTSLTPAGEGVFFLNLMAVMQSMETLTALLLSISIYTSNPGSMRNRVGTQTLTFYSGSHRLRSGEPRKKVNPFVLSAAEGLRGI